MPQPSLPRMNERVNPCLGTDALLPAPVATSAFTEAAAAPVRDKK